MNAAVSAMRAARMASACAKPSTRRRFVRRARPLLGTLVEIGALDDIETIDELIAVDVVDDEAREAAIAAAFDRIAAVQASLSRFDATSEIGMFNAAASGASIAVGIDAQRVLAAAYTLRDASDGAFDISLGSGAAAWHCEGGVLRKLSANVRLDLGGIAKGYAVDVGVEALVAEGVSAGWVNAGGDLRVFGAATVPIDLRDEVGGGVRRFARLGDGAFATSRLVDAGGTTRHASVAAPRCLWADALTKLVIARGDAALPLLGRFRARAWLHSPAGTGVEA